MQSILKLLLKKLDLGKEIAVSEPHWLSSYIPSYREDELMFELVAQLKSKGYKTAVLSNIEEPISQFIQSKKYQNIDSFIFSCEVKMSKPDKEVYEYALNVLESTPQETLFIDDRKENIDSANSLGILGHHFQDHETLITLLNNTTIL